MRGWQQTRRVPRPAPLPALHRPALITFYQKQSFTGCLPGRLPTEVVQCHEIYIHLYIYTYIHIYVYIINSTSVIVLHISNQ